LTAVDGVFEACWVRSKITKTGICCFFAEHTALGRKSKDWMAQNLDNVSRVEPYVYLWTCFSELGLNNPTKHFGLVLSGHHHDLIEM